MKFTMRLYRRHDMDLLLLHKTKGFSVQKAVKTALLMHLGLIETRPIPYPACSDRLNKFYPSSQLHLTLSEYNQNEKQVIDFLTQIPKGFRNSYCKNLTRYYLEKPSRFSYTGDQINM